MLYRHYKILLVFATIATLFLATNASAYNEWPYDELDKLQPIEDGRYGAPILTTPYPGMATNILLSGNLATEGLSLYIPIIEDKDGNPVIPVIREAQWKTYVPLFKTGEPVVLPRGQPKITLPMTEEDGILYIPLDTEISKHQTLNMPALQYGEHEDCYVVPIYSTEGYDYVIPLIREINTKHKTHTFDPWPVEHNPLLSLEYQIGGA